MTHTTCCQTVVYLSRLSLSVCLSVCDVGVLWPNGWMDQDETWHAGRPQPWPHCVRWGLSSPIPQSGRSPPFLAHICCGQMAGWIKMKLGMQVDLGPGHIVSDGDPAPPLPKEVEPPIFGPYLLWPNCWMDLHPRPTFLPLDREVASAQATLCYLGTQLPPPKGDRAPNFRPMSIVAKWLDGSRCHLTYR